METEALKVTVQGLVQGIGFRPFVRDIARQCNLTGYVQNTGVAVEIFCVGNKADCDRFLYELKNNKLPHARLDFIKTETVNATDIPSKFYIRDSSDDSIRDSSDDSIRDSFDDSIRDSSDDSIRDSFDDSIRDSSDDSIRDCSDSAISDSLPSIPPDLAICDHCRFEMQSQLNRRHNHQFISCTACGPRYTIIRNMPYDRSNTSFAEFSLCHECEKEYNTPGNIRSHAQTISCFNCGPQLNKFSTDSAVFIIKGTGGFHLACNARDNAAVEHLRLIKGREAKPFAVMFPGIDEIKKICFVSPLEESLLTSSAAPIVLLKIKKRVFPENVCQNSLYCGCFLPYTPLHILITKQTGALVLTSANASGEPIIHKDNEIVEFASKNNICVITHNREILRPIDDSVIKVIHGEPIFFRRARGYVPEIIRCKSDIPVKALAMGGDLKSSFCLRLNDTYCLSQPLGDMEGLAVNNAVSELLTDWYNLFRFKPDIAVCDMHPNYFSRDLALGETKTIFVQHHHAHIASVIAEYNIDKPVIGVAFDGTGYGPDGGIWGGEFLICNGAEYERAAHFAYTKIIGGDDSAKDAEKTAFCFLNTNEPSIIRKALDADINTAYTSSAGRLFDAAACITGISNRNRYEGECAMLLEREAESALDSGIKPIEMEFNVRDERGILIIEYKDLLEKLDPNNKQASALGFHKALADVILGVCIKLRILYEINAVILTGGVFQNKVLTELTMDNLSASGFESFRNIKTPPNDGSLALGQAYLAGLKGKENVCCGIG